MLFDIVTGALVTILVASIMATVQAMREANSGWYYPDGTPKM